MWDATDSGVGRDICLDALEIGFRVVELYQGFDLLDLKTRYVDNDQQLARLDLGFEFLQLATWQPYTWPAIQ